jgi:hypothetical protein
MNNTHVDRMIAAGMIERADLSEADEELINALSDDEIDAMIRTDDKLIKRGASGKVTGAVIF